MEKQFAFHTADSSSACSAEGRRACSPTSHAAYLFALLDTIFMVSIFVVISIVLLSLSHITLAVLVLVLVVLIALLTLAGILLPLISVSILSSRFRTKKR